MLSLGSYAVAEMNSECEKGQVFDRDIGICLDCPEGQVPDEKGETCIEAPAEIPEE
jgi:hypothetical protein